MKIKINISCFLGEDGQLIHRKNGLFQIEIIDEKNNFSATTSWLHAQDEGVIIERVGALSLALRPKGPKLEYFFSPIDIGETTVVQNATICHKGEMNNDTTKNFKLSQER